MTPPTPNAIPNNAWTSGVKPPTEVTYGDQHGDHHGDTHGDHHVNPMDWQSVQPVDTAPPPPTGSSW